MSVEPDVMPNGKQIDALIAKFAGLQKAAAEAGKVAKEKSAAADVVKAELVALVERWGVRHAAKSKRLKGTVNTATTTVSTRVSVDDAGVQRLREYLSTSESPELAGAFFSERVTYQLVSSPKDVLQGMSLTTKLRKKINSLLGGCFEMSTTAPSLKVEVA